MKTFPTTLLLSVLLAAGAAATSARAQDEPTCEDFRCEFQARLDQDCSCADQTNHGQYVSCVAHVVNDLVDEGLPTNCKGKLTRCAARSVCGKQDRGFSTCTTSIYGTCVTNDDGTSTCENDPTIACTSDTDCGVVGTRCRITRHPETCAADGGAVDLAPTCCASCTTTP